MTNMTDHDFRLDQAQSYRPTAVTNANLAGHAVRLAAPARLALPAKKPAPLLIIKGDEDAFAAAVEMQRLMSSTNEIADGPAIGVAAGIKDTDLNAIINQAVSQYNLDPARVVIFPDAVRDHDQIDGACREASLARDLMDRWPTGRAYGQETALLKKPLVSLLAKLLRPLMARLAARPPKDGEADLGMILHADGLGRDYEIFITLPDDYNRHPDRRYPLLVTLDGNIMYAPARSIAGSLAAQNLIDDAIIVGVGVPRSEGTAGFALRRLEEFAPPIDAYQFDDVLGAILTPLYALKGKRIADDFGQAAQLHQFVTGALLPLLDRNLRLDHDRLALFGHSAGGTYVAYEMMCDDSPFTQFLCSSPGLAISGNWLWHQSVPDRSAAPRKVVFGMGGEEPANGFNNDAGIPGTPDYADQWRQSGDQVSMITFDGETHSSVIARMLAAGLLQIWGKPS